MRKPIIHIRFSVYDFLSAFLAILCFILCIRRSAVAAFNSHLFNKPTIDRLIDLPARRYSSAVALCLCLSVCLSARPSQASVVSRWLTFVPRRQAPLHLCPYDIASEARSDISKIRALLSETFLKVLDLQKYFVDRSLMLSTLSSTDDRRMTNLRLCN